MKVALTGASGFVGRYLVQQLLQDGHQCRCWRRPTSDVQSLPDDIEWVTGQLNSPEATRDLLEGCDAVIHAALDRPGDGFRGAEGDLIEFVERNLLGSLRLMEEARRQQIERFVFISTCAVHEQILDDRLLDEAHPLWPLTHYGAHKAAIEKFIHAFGLGQHFPVCALRPTGIYGAAHPIEHSKWFELVKAVVDGRDVNCQRGGKEVHVADVAKAATLLLNADGIEGQAFNCYERYVSEFEVAQLAKQVSGSPADIQGGPKSPKHQIETGKLRALGMEFGGEPLLRKTVQTLVQAAQSVEAH
ncbi:MAG: nucleoside-diphosphate sugar epimerase [Planctomycetaceae bacterium]|nr:nucleoside-diphosphate sugar epimerase [Planctomycetaceae bacterium]